jgi:hypothetical protein
VKDRWLIATGAIDALLAAFPPTRRIIGDML